MHAAMPRQIKQHSTVMKMAKVFRAVLGILVLLAAGKSLAGPVGEMHRVATDSTASLRDAEHRPELRITVVYPAATDAIELNVAIGPPGKPRFDVGSRARCGLCIRCRPEARDPSLSWLRWLGQDDGMVRHSEGARWVHRDGGGSSRQQWHGHHDRRGCGVVAGPRRGICVSP